ncbi:hypothetical protein, partial [Nocardia nova]|uniref:hypothetical protein n=1 Tax=Nocardia nova TaxID=37330 RepID=UPI001C3FC948
MFTLRRRTFQALCAECRRRSQLPRPTGTLLAGRSRALCTWPLRAGTLLAWALRTWTLRSRPPGPLCTRALGVLPAGTLRTLSTSLRAGATGALLSRSVRTGSGALSRPARNLLPRGVRPARSGLRSRSTRTLLPWSTGAAR